MVNRTFFVLFFLFVLCFSCKNNNRSQQVRSLPQTEAKPLIALAQLWGFLKYHHPAVAEGRYDWDGELIKRINAIEELREGQKWKKLLDDWIDSLPAVKENPNKRLPELEVKQKPDYGRLFDTAYFYPETIDKIRYILNHAVVNSNYYVSRASLSFTNEPAYEELVFPSFAYRLLALFRYWNIVNYFFPYREMCEQKWSAVLEEMLPEFIQVENEEEYLLACSKLVAKIDDSHTFFYSPSLAWSNKIGFLQVPFETRFVEGKLAVTKFVNKDSFFDSGVELGDIITAIDGKPVDQIVAGMWPYTPASNDAVKLRKIALFILRGNARQVTLSVQRENKRFDLKVFRYPMGQLHKCNSRLAEEGYRILDNGIGYVQPALCKVQDRDRGIKKVLNGTKGLIIDLRYYPDDYISVPFSKYLGSASKPHSISSYSNISFPGYFFVHSYRVKPGKTHELYKNKVVVIVNENTQSKGEDHVLSFQLCPNVTVIGSTTAGANGSVVDVNLPGGILTRMTRAGVYYPDGSNVQRTGVKIDEMVKPTLEGIKNGKDELLERAIEIIENSNFVKVEFK